MSAVPDGAIDSDRILSLASKHHGAHQRPCTKRIAELEALTARLRAELQEAEAELQREKARVPLPGDFVRCPLTNFFGRVTKVTPRPRGRAWVEIILYLGPGLPGHSAMDLFDSWELIDPPARDDGSQKAADGSPRLPTIAPFMPLIKATPGSMMIEDETETSLQGLWQPSGNTSW